ncbi:GNAT family N-acetyltransferase [Nocardia heshunensis]
MSAEIFAGSWEVRLLAADSDDLTGLAAVHLATRRSAYADLLPRAVLNDMTAAALAEEWRNRLAGTPQPHRTMVAVRNDISRKVVGFAHVCTTPDGLGELFAIHVHPEAQGAGVGRRLLLTAIESIRDFGYDRARLWVLEGNNHARSFYLRQGWHPRPDLRRHEDINGATVPEIAYERTLPPR